MIEDKISEYQIYTFEECLSIAEETKLPRHILLGNGFSISFDNQFHYFSLTNSLDKHLRDLISRYYYNPETAMNHCDTHQNKDNIKIKKENIRTEIINKIIDLHPRSFFDIDQQYTENCYKNLLQHFNKIFTTNFDLLLYTVTIHCKYLTQEKHALSDGFYNQHDGDNKDKLIYRGQRDTSDAASVLYLHGAIHLFVDQKEVEYNSPLFPILSTPNKFIIDDPNTVVKLKSDEKNKTLINQIKVIIDNQERSPLVIFAENYNQKVLEIQSHSYLTKVYNLFKGKGNGKNKIKSRCLFIFGHSLNSELDKHLAHEIQISNNIDYIFYGIHKMAFKTKNELDKEIERIDDLFILKAYSADIRNRRKLYFYDTSEMDIWGKEKMNTQFQHLKL